MASYSVAQAVILSIDSSALSGVVLSAPEEERSKTYESVSFSEVTTQAQRERWVKDAIAFAEDCELPLVIVGEEWTPHGMSYKSFSTLCESWGLWRAEFERAGVADRVVRVLPNTWRNAVFGPRRPRDTANLKKHAVLYAQRSLGMPPQLSDNIAEAACIRVWATQADAVHAMLKPKRRARDAK